MGGPMLRDGATRLLTMRPRTMPPCQLSGVFMPRVPRRVVTGHNAEGKSIFIADAPTPHVFQRSPGSAIVMEMWETDATPAEQPRQRRRHRPRLPPAAAQERQRVPHHRISAGQGAPQGARRRARRAGRRLRLAAGRRQGRRAPSRLPQDQLGRLRHRAVGRNPCADGRRRGPAQDRRRADPARHQPRLEQPHRRAVLPSPSC